MRTPPAIASLADLYAEALALETEAGERYADLAGQMEMHNNRETALLFRKLAALEARHAAAIRERAGPALACRPRGNRWLSAERPETADLDEAHYLMTPAHALHLALANEERAEAHYLAIARAASEPAIRKLAEEFAAEERQHIAHLRAWLARQPAPAESWADDPDPPVYSE